MSFVPCPCGWAGLKHYAWKKHVAVQPQSTDRVEQLARELGHPLLAAGAISRAGRKLRSTRT
jgi:hypothetical protein